jgi:hypothetical protein
MSNRKHNIIVLAVAALVSVCILFIGKKDKQQEITSQVFHRANGWGYDILVDEKLFIRQESVPTQTGNAGFPSKEQAEKTALLIINKMKRGDHPTVTTFELQQILPLNTTANGQPGKH